MQYGAMNFPILPVLEEISTISSLGFDYLELTMDPPGAHYSVIRKQEKEIRNALDGHGLDLVCHLPTFVHTADLADGIREASVQEVLESLRAAARLNPKKIVLHPGYIGGLGPFVMDQAMALAKESLGRIIDQARNLGFSICIENMFPKYPGWTEPDDFLSILDEFPSLMLTLDIGHANIGSKREKRVLDFIQTFKNRIGHIHASDNFGKEDSHLPIGAGNIDFARAAKALKKIGYNGTITLEVFSGEKRYLRFSKEIMSELFGK
ncbi:MAG: sugar phosphate isomerase [Deltaproteobacteria bacterium RBG_13_49_15]|nr:MAG: sugar phosphate isomerase [Deltaproteobacteria bacterium RBG_13_49_15]